MAGKTCCICVEKTKGVGGGPLPTWCDNTKLWNVQSAWKGELQARFSLEEIYFYYATLHQNNKSFLPRLQWLCSYTASDLCKPWKLCTVLNYVVYIYPKCLIIRELYLPALSVQFKDNLYVYSLLHQRHFLIKTK